MRIYRAWRNHARKISYGCGMFVCFCMGIFFYHYADDHLLLHSHTPNLTFFDEDITSIVNILQESRTQLILADKQILKNIEKISYLYEFSNVSSIVTFFVIPPPTINSRIYVGNINNILKMFGFEVAVIHNVNPKQIGPRLFNVPIAIFAKRNIIVHLIPLHERVGGFWWIGSLMSDPSSKHLLSKWNLSVDDCQLMKYEGALDKFVTKEFNIGGQIIVAPKNISSFLNNIENSQFIECNHTRAELFNDKYGWIETKGRREKARQFKKLLLKTKEVLDKLQMRFWLHGGTFLGYFRQCHIIPYDKDMDIAIFIQNYRENIIEKFTYHNFQFRLKYGLINDSLELSFRKFRIKLDIQFFYEDVNGIWHGGSIAESGKKYKFTYPPINLCWTEFLDIKVSVPCDTIKYVVEGYGHNWSLPITDWSWRLSPPNAHENGFWTKEEKPKAIEVNYDI